MSDKEMIEIIRQDVYNCFQKNGVTLQATFDFYNLGYRKLFKDSVVLSKEEYEEYKEFKSFMERNDWEDVKHIENTLDKCQEILYERLQQERKKIAENYKISMMLSIQEMQKYLEIDEEQAKLLYYHNAQVAKQFGVGTKE